MKKTKKILALVLAVLTVCVCSGCLKYTSNILEVTNVPSTTAPVVPTTRYYPDYTQAYTPTAPTDVYEPSSSVIVPTTTMPDIPTTLPGVTEPTTMPTVPTTIPPVDIPTTQEAVKDPSQWSGAETLKFLTDAMNKSRAVTTTVNVHHTENFSFNVSEVTGGDIVKNLANKIIGSVAEPSDENLTFNGGTATNSEGEVVPLLLPKKGNFYLDEAGCTSISASRSGSDTIVKITLIKESVDMTSVPKYNSSACGYLDISTLDLSIITITSFNIDYQATTLTITVNGDGYVTKAAYHVPLALDAAGKSGFISAVVKASGYEDEVWEVNW